MRAAPFRGEPLFENTDAAIAVLYDWTGQRFGNDAAAWGQWLRKNRSVYYRPYDSGVWATVTKVGTLEWRVIADDGRRMTARITARVHTLKIPTLQVGDRVKVQVSPNTDDLCALLLSASPVVWVPRGRTRSVK